MHLKDGIFSDSRNVIVIRIIVVIKTPFSIKFSPLNSVIETELSQTDQTCNIPFLRFALSRRGGVAI